MKILRKQLNILLLYLPLMQVVCCFMDHYTFYFTSGEAEGMFLLLHLKKEVFDC